MQELACKIRKILSANELNLNDQFIEFFKSDEQLQHLSKLIYALKLQSTHQGLVNEILEPNCSENLAENKNNVEHQSDPQVEEKSHSLNENVDLEELTDQVEKLAVDEKKDLVETNHSENGNEFSQQDVSEQNLEILSENQAENELSQHHIQPNFQLVASEKSTDDLVADQNQVASVAESAVEIDEILIDVVSEQTLEQQAQIENNRAEITEVFSKKKIYDLKFQVDNARAGQTYSSKIQVLSAMQNEKIEFIAESFKFPNEVFLFDDESQTLKGQPTQAEEFNFSFDYCVNGEMYSGQCRLNVIADPRSLWKVIEPEAGQAFAKAHLAELCIDMPKSQLIAASRRGRSHEHAGSFRDDDFSLMHIPQSDWSVLAVADGAGSAEYSREGSRIAVEIVQNEFKKYLNQHNIDDLNADIQKWQLDQPQHPETQRIANKLNQQFYNVYYEIYRSILTQLDQLALNMNVSSKAFSTTLLVAVVYQHNDKSLVSTFSVGDGAIAAFSHDAVRIMNVADGGEYAGQTKFLDRSIHQELGSRVKIGCFKDLDAVLLMTDGISDPIFETDAGLANQQKWRDLYAELQPIFQNEKPKQQLLEWMHFFKTGHHDDRTLAALFKKSHVKKSYETDLS